MYRFVPVSSAGSSNSDFSSTLSTDLLVTEGSSGCCLCADSFFML
jgi:hypothetical protein